MRGLRGLEAKVWSGRDLWACVPKFKNRPEAAPAYVLRLRWEPASLPAQYLRGADTGFSLFIVAFSP
jgi:hypothetical protein